MSLAPITKDMLDVLTDIQVEEEVYRLPPCEGESHPQVGVPVWGLARLGGHLVHPAHRGVIVKVTADSQSS